MSTRLNISGCRVSLRSVEPSDIEVMYGVENDLHNWGVSGTTQPFSKYILEQFVEAQRVDPFVSKQLRLMVNNEVGDVVGIVDIFDIDIYNHRAGVGIITLEEYRGRGYALEVLKVLEGYARDLLQLHQLWCGVAGDNSASIRLFERAGYQRIGVKREWLWRVDGYQDEIAMQRIL